MNKLHVEFDLIVTDKDAKRLLNAPDICLCVSIMSALEVYDDYEGIANFKIYEIDNGSR